MQPIRITMYLPEPRRIKGVGSRGRQYEAGVREGVLCVEAGVAKLPSGKQVICEGDLVAFALAAAKREGWVTDRDLAEGVAEIYAARRDSEPIRQLRLLTVRASGLGGKSLPDLLGVHPRDLAFWRSGRGEMPADIAAKIAALLG